jgi:hypothetical protein
MHRFDTPEPIAVRLEVAAGDVWLTAGDRDDTVVEVRPSNPERRADVKAADQVEVDYASGRLLVRTPRTLSPLGPRGMVDIAIELPAGSDVSGDAAWADLRADGRLGDVDFGSSAASLRLGEVRSLRAKTSSGQVTVDRVTGEASVSAAHGQVRIGAVGGSATVKNASGTVWLGDVAGPLRVSAASGTITVDRAQASLHARTAHGAVRIGEIVRDDITVGTAYGDVEIGVREGTAAWLDLRSDKGTVRNTLDDADGPGASEETAEVRARTSYGDILVRRA